MALNQNGNSGDKQRSLRASSGIPRVTVFIERDYSQGIQVRFQEKFPLELEGKVRILPGMPYVLAICVDSQRESCVVYFARWILSCFKASFTG